MQENSNFKDIIKSERFIETAILILFVSIFIFLKLAQPLNYELSHQYPTFYNANDNFGNGYSMPQYVKEVGNFKYEPPNTVSGFKDVVGYYPPLQSHLGAMASIITGVETYDATNIIAILFSIPPFILIYFVIRRYSKELAILSLPFMLGIFNFNFEVERAFGQWIYITGALFLASVVWLADRLHAKYSSIFLAILLTGAALGHMSEAIFSAGFLAVFMALRYLKEKQLDMPALKNVIIGFTMFAIIASYYLIIFKNSWMVGFQQFSFEVMSVSPIAASLGVKITDFGIVVLLVLAGLLIGIKQLAFRKKEEFPFTAVIAGIYILIIGYGNYFGLGLRAWQSRHAWPIYFSVFCGIVIYSLGAKYFKNWNYKHYAILSVTLIILFSYTHIGMLKGGGLIDQDGWNALMWIKNNTPEDANIGYFYGTLPSQPMSLWSTNRIAYIVDLEDYSDGIKKGIVKDNYTMMQTNEIVNAYYPYRKTLFSYGYHNDTSTYFLYSNDLNYYVFPLAISATNNQYVSQYNLMILQELLKQEKIKETYKNGAYAIFEVIKLNDTAA
ncbi:MAG: hypothetical protein ABIF85_03835 [Nanoarchaeota archaeon]|nr:hypothetical protein [Nanoarchaeota archaeon]MBU4300091.1 hypothetical protein [Nanoarchaeota archaeon]MBU4452293.1 hypothetical protein [Nanoarchaeota archaeon]MCG2723818.1 hypothetical protein [archaeon]